MARKHRERSSVFRRRKPSSSRPSHKRNGTTQENNACSDSTITSNRDESPSACTDLPLNSCSPSVLPSFLVRISSPQNHQPCQFQMGSSQEKMVILRNGCFEKVTGSSRGFCSYEPTVMALGVDQSGFSDSNSEISVTELMANNSANRCMYGEIDNTNDKSNLPFFDFLGVGAT